MEALNTLGMAEFVNYIKPRQCYGEQILQLLHRMVDQILQQRQLTTHQPLEFPVDADEEALTQQSMNSLNGGASIDDEIEDLAPEDDDYDNNDPISIVDHLGDSLKQQSPTNLSASVQLPT